MVKYVVQATRAIMMNKELVENLSFMLQRDCGGRRGAG